MKDKIKTIIWPSLKYELKDFQQFVRQIYLDFAFWQWQKTEFNLNDQTQYKVQFFGLVENLAPLKALLATNDNTSQEKVGTFVNEDSNKIYVYQCPMPGTLCIPQCLSTIVKLDKPIEGIMGTYSKSLRRSINKQLPKFKYQVINDEQAVNEINTNMLEPYAIARHDIGAHQLGVDAIKSLALTKYGRLDLLLENEQAVGCHLGNHYVRRGKRYWHVNRFGYPENIFSDYSRWGEINSINLHLALVSAIDNGYDYCDYGMSLARPGSGLIEWKRRRKGYLTKESRDGFYLKPPKKGVAQFFWQSPLFALSGKKVNLHLGLPADKTDEEIASKYHEMGYGGLSKVFLQCEKTPSESLVESIQKLYANQEYPPKIVVSLVK